MSNDKTPKTGATPPQSGSRVRPATPSAAVAKRLDARKGVRTRVKSAKLALEAAEAEARRNAAAASTTPSPAETDLTAAQVRARGKGRPAVDELVRRDNTIAAKVSTAERALINAKADQAGMTLSTYVREIAKTGRVSPRIVKSPASADPALLVQLIPIGNNLNQIAHSLNAMRGYVPADLHKNLAWLGAILERIQTLDRGGT